MISKDLWAIAKSSLLAGPYCIPVNEPTTCVAPDHFPSLETSHSPLSFEIPIPLNQTMAVRATWTAIFIIATLRLVACGDNNRVYSPCSDTKVARSDGFTFGIAFASRDVLLRNGANSTSQLSPCDSRLSLSSSNSQIAVFRPKVDEISLLSVNSSSFAPVRSLSLSFVL